MQQDIETDVLIIGAGPAGLAAAMYTARANKKTIVLRGKAQSRLSMAHAIENYPGFVSIKGDALLALFEEQAKVLGAQILDADAIDLGLSYEPKMVNTRNGMIIAKVVIIATGKGSTGSTIENEEKLVGYGVSYCAVCDGAFYKNKKVIVYGKDEEAIHDALMLADLGCDTTVLFTPPLTELSGEVSAKLQAGNIQIIDGARLTKIAGTTLVTGVEYIKDGVSSSLETNAVFIIAHAPGSALLRRAGIELDDKNCIVVNDKQETNIPGVYGAGDAAGRGMQIATAVGDGVNSALVALRFLKN